MRAALILILIIAFGVTCYKIGRRDGWIACPERLYHMGVEKGQREALDIVYPPPLNVYEWRARVI